MVTTLQSVVVVGASLAGLRAAETLRAEGYDGRLVMIGAEAHEPYDRPPLSKEVLRGEWGPQRVLLRKQGLADLRLDLRLGRRASGVDLTRRIVALDDGTAEPYDGLIIATGAEPRHLRAEGKLAGIHVLRTLDDALAVHDALASRPRVLVVGAGFIGLEVAASCRARGLEVSIVEPQPQPLSGILGEAMGALFADMHRDHGVRLFQGVAVTKFEGRDRVERVRLSDETVLDTDLVIVGVGVKPCTDWLDTSGLELNDGVTCDECCRASAPNVVAAGDVARWAHRRYGRHVRVEHWMNAAEQGSAAARTLLAGDRARPYAPIPAFWSDQYDVKIQFAGMAPSGAEVRVVSGDVTQRRFVALYGKAGRLTGVLAVRRASQFIRYTEMLERSASWDDALGPRT